MPNWNEVAKEIQAIQRPDALDFIRRKYLKKLYAHSKRNLIAYYSGWLQKPGMRGTVIDDGDKNGFMTTIHQLDRPKGLDLILHTPGGGIGATESIINYLHAMFGDNIRAIIPQLAMSGGTMIACACREIIMGKQSNLGPIDPQYNGIPTEGVVEEFKRAKQEIEKYPSTIPLWQAIFRQYHPTFIGECEKANDWSEEIATECLQKVMFSREKNAGTKAKAVVKKLHDHVAHKSHERHIHREDCRKIGLKIVDLENNDKFQDLVLTVHHAYMHTFAGTSAIKIIENHKGIAMVHHVAPSLKS
jgi:ClpP class serine protease